MFHVWSPEFDPWHQPGDKIMNLLKDEWTIMKNSQLSFSIRIIQITAYTPKQLNPGIPYDMIWELYSNEWRQVQHYIHNIKHSHGKCVIV